MLKAIHKKSGELVSASKIEFDASWKGTKDDKWIAPYSEIKKDKLEELEGEDPEVSFIGKHSRKNLVNKDFVAPHFKAKNKKVSRVIKPESYEHRFAKQTIYQEIWDNNIIIEGERIRDKFDIDNIDIESRKSSSGKAIVADVIVEFKEEDKRYGKGIIFEIQFSYQNKEETEERTYDRVLEGFSVVWLWEDDFDEEMNINKNKLSPTPFIKAIENYTELKEKELRDKLRNLSRDAEKKINTIKSEIQNYKEKSLEEIQEKKEEASNKYLNLSKEEDRIKKKLEEEKRKLKEELNEISDRKIREIKRQILYAKKDLKAESIKKIEDESMKLRDGIKQELKKEISPYSKEKLKKQIKRKVKEQIPNNLVEFLEIIVKSKKEEENGKKDKTE